MKKTCVLFLLVGVFFELWGQSGVIRGRVYDLDSNEPVPFANLVIDGTQIGSTSDFDGDFIFTGLEPGFYRLQVSSVGYGRTITEEFQVTNSRAASLEIGMEPQAAELEEVVVQVSAFREREESPVSLRTLTVSEIERSPGSNRDISRVIQSFPGVASGVAFRNDVIVRGGGPSENSFFLDGIEIPNINHFATQGASGGPAGIINVDFIRELDYYAGAFPANRGNALSSVMEFRQVNGSMDDYSLRATVGASDLALTYDGPLGPNTSVVVSARRSYLQFLFDILGLPFLPVYSDFQFKTRTRINSKNELTFIGLGAIDDFSLNTGLSNPDETQEFILRTTPINQQWNYTIGGIYRNFGSSGNNALFISRNMLENSSYKYPDNNEDLDRVLDFTSWEIENKLRYERTERRGRVNLMYGGGVEYAKYFNDFYREIFVPGQGLSAIEYDSWLTLMTYSVFAQANRRFMDERLTLALGVRMDGSDYSRSMSTLTDQFSPRLSASYRLNPKWSANFNTGRFYQLPAYTTLGYRDGEGTLVNRQNEVTYIGADHIVAGLAWNPRSNAQFTLEGFYKDYFDYPFSLTDSISLANQGADFGVVGDEPVSSTSEGRAYGFEVLARDREFFLETSIILSYTFVRSEFKDKNQEYRPTSWDNIHLLNFTVLRELPNNWDIGAKFRFVGGPPYTPYNMQLSGIKNSWDVRGDGVKDFNQLNDRRLGSFHQLDLRVDKAWFFPKWSLMLYLDIQNVYNFQAESEPNLLVKRDENNEPITFIGYDGLERYELRKVNTTTGTILPTIGIMVEI